MPEDSLRSTIDAIGRRLHDELEAQLTQLSSRHQDELESARRAAEAEAEQRWSAKVDEVRAEWTARLESEVTSARGEAERRMVAEAMRLRAEAEQAAAGTAARARQELEDSLEQERARAAIELERARGLLSSERDTVRQELEATRRQLEEAGRQLEAAREERAALENAAREEREALESDLRRQIGAVEENLSHQRSALEEDARRRVAAAEDEGHRQLTSLQEQVTRAAAARAQAEAELARERREREDDVREQAQRVEAAAEARVAERQVQLAVVERILTAVRSLDTARSLSQVLSALLTSAAAEAPRVALFVMNGAELKGWKAEGFGVNAAALEVNGNDDGLLAEALRRSEPAVTSDGGPAAPGCANLPADRAAIAVPLLVGAQPVAVLYADDAGDAPQQVPASWPEAIQILCRHASVNLAHLTAARAADTMRRSVVPPAPAAGTSPTSADDRAPAPGPGGAEDSNSARRYARLLVSEIKLYNEPAVRLGREKRDLLTRLKPEIARARRLYEQRISTAIDSRGALFQQELVQTLADGDPALLGGSA